MELSSYNMKFVCVMFVCVMCVYVCVFVWCESICMCIQRISCVLYKVSPANQ